MLQTSEHLHRTPSFHNLGLSLLARAHNFTAVIVELQVSALAVIAGRRGE
jgi:hypothetical protein